MAAIDYSGNFFLTFTNNAPEIAATDAGSAQHGKQYLDTDRWIQLYRVNVQVLLHKNDTLKIKVETSEEVAYYMSLNGVDGITVAQSAN